MFFLQGFTVDNSPGNSNSVENCNSNIKMQIIGQNSNVNCVTGQVNGIKMSPLQHPHHSAIMYQPIPLSPVQQQTQPTCGSVSGQTEINSLQVTFPIIVFIYYFIFILIYSYFS